MSGTRPPGRLQSLNVSGRAVTEELSHASRGFSSFSPLGLGSGSEDSSPSPSTSPGLQASTLPPLTPKSHATDDAHLIASQSPPTSMVGTGSAFADPPTERTNLAPRQSAIPALLSSWSDGRPSPAELRTFSGDVVLAENDTPHHFLCSPQLGDFPVPNTATAPSATAPADQGQHDLAYENDVLRYNVNILKGLALQLATQLDLAQARNALHEHTNSQRPLPSSPSDLATASARSDQGSAPMTKSDPSPPKEDKEGSRERVLLDALERKDEIIASLRAQLAAQETWYEQALQQSLKAKNIALERLVPKRHTQVAEEEA